MNLLIHICCGPCSIIPLADFKLEDISVSGVYFNPNIHPFSEYERRLGAARQYCEENGVGLIEGPYLVADYFRALAGQLDKPERCRRCFRLRLGRTAEMAKERGFDAFSTTLLVSPYQQHEDLRAAGAAVSGEQGIEFIYRDFRAGYHDSVVESRRLGMYRQSYCGCLFSEHERILEKKALKERRMSETR